MKSLFVTAIVLMCAPVFANDAAHKDAKHEQMMKECMAKQDASLSKDAAMKACEEKMKAMHEAKKDEAHKDAEHK